VQHSGMTISVLNIIKDLSGLFPIEIASVRRDHEFLDHDSVRALCRRLTTLNKCAAMSLEVHFRCKQSEDSEEDDACALSSRWAFQRESKTWSRLCTVAPGDGVVTLRPSASSDSVLSDFSHLDVTSLTSDLSLSSLSLDSARETTSPGVASGESSDLVQVSSSRDENDDVDFSNSSSPPSVREKPRRTSRLFLRRMESLRRRNREKEKVTTGVSTELDFRDRPGLGLHCTLDASLPGLTKNKRGIGKDSAWKAHTICRTNISQSEATVKPQRACLYLEDYQLAWEKPKLTNHSSLHGKERRVVHLPSDHKPGTFPKSLSIESLCPAPLSECSDRIDWPVEDGEFSLGGGSSSHSESQDFLSTSFAKRRNSVGSIGSSKGWHSVNGPDNTELSYKKVGDGHPIRLWRISAEMEAPPPVVLQRVLRERHLWDEDLLHSRVIETLENNTEVFHYITDSMAPHPRRDFVVLRYKYMYFTSLLNPNKRKLHCVLSSCSVLNNTLWKASQLITTFSFPVFVVFVSYRGRSPDWYNKVFGHLCAAEVARIRGSFPVLSARGPETKI
uniref:StAR-related lipid transfer (START) domain containing 8 n=1 Tax=Astyanax mexicanus TaxID=7994 RepID=A0A8B9LFY2_ASTMX